MAVNAGFVNTGDLSQAKHGVVYAWSPWRDAFRQFRDESRLPAAAQGGEKLHPGVTLGKDLVFADIQALSGAGDYRAFAHCLTQALHRWGVLPEGTGFVDGETYLPNRGAGVRPGPCPVCHTCGEVRPISAGSLTVPSPWAMASPPRWKTSGFPSQPIPLGRKTAGVLSESSSHRRGGDRDG